VNPRQTGPSASRVRRSVRQVHKKSADQPRRPEAAPCRGLQHGPCAKYVCQAALWVHAPIRAASLGTSPTPGGRRGPRAAATVAARHGLAQGKSPMTRLSIYALRFASLRVDLSAPRRAGIANLITSRHGNGGGWRTAFTATGDVSPLGTLTCRRADFCDSGSPLRPADRSRPAASLAPPSTVRPKTGFLRHPDFCPQPRRRGRRRERRPDRNRRQLVFSDQTHVSLRSARRDGGDCHDSGARRSPRAFATTGVLDSGQRAVAVGNKDLGGSFLGSRRRARPPPPGPRSGARSSRGTATFSNFTI